MSDDKFRPSYYKRNNHDLWWFFEKGLLSYEEFLGFLKGNVFKYLTRFPKKNGLEDVHKATEYCKQIEKVVQRKMEIDAQLVEISPENKQMPVESQTKNKNHRKLYKGLGVTIAIASGVLLFTHFKNHEI